MDINDTDLRDQRQLDYIIKHNSAQQLTADLQRIQGRFRMQSKKRHEGTLAFLNFLNHDYELESIESLSRKPVFGQILKCLAEGRDPMKRRTHWYRRRPNNRSQYRATFLHRAVQGHALHGGSHVGRDKGQCTATGTFPAVQWHKRIAQDEKPVRDKVQELLKYDVKKSADLRDNLGLKPLDWVMLRNYLGLLDDFIDFTFENTETDTHAFVNVLQAFHIGLRFVDNIQPVFKAICKHKEFDQWMCTTLINCLDFVHLMPLENPENMKFLNDNKKKVPPAETIGSRTFEALHYAGMFYQGTEPQCRVVEVLLSAGADPNSIGYKIQQRGSIKSGTPLHFLLARCAQLQMIPKGMEKMMILLLEHKADPEVQNAKSKTCYGCLNEEMKRHFHEMVERGASN